MEHAAEVLQLLRDRLVNAGDLRATWMAVLRSITPLDWHPAPRSGPSRPNTERLAEFVQLVMSTSASEDEMDELPALLDEGTDEFERYLTRRLNVPTRWITLTALVTWERTATEQRRESVGVAASQHLVTRDVSAALIEPCCSRPNCKLSIPLRPPSF